MTLRFVPTPIVDGPLERPRPRSDSFDPKLAEAFVASSALEAGIARLRRPGALAVTTGQQPGLFTGPLYTIHKALSAAGLARVLEQQWSRPVVPVFWLAGDDHDYTEASQASWIGADGAVVTATLPPRPPEAPLTPMYRQPLGPEVGAALDRLAADLPDSEFRQSTLEWLRRHYRHEATVAGSYAGAMAELLAPLGVICLDSTHPAVKRAMAPYLVQALTHAADLERDLDRHIEALGTTARTSGVTVGDGASLVMLEAALGRDRLVADGSTFVTRRSRERLDLAALQRIADESPTRLSPNVLLRPVLRARFFLPSRTWPARASCAISC